MNFADSENTLEHRVTQTTAFNAKHDCLLLQLNDRSLITIITCTIGK